MMTPHQKLAELHRALRARDDVTAEALAAELADLPPDEIRRAQLAVVEPELHAGCECHPEGRHGV